MTDIINEEENTDSLPEEEQESVVVDNGQTYASSETAVIAQQAAEQAKLWAQESERQANLSSGSATIAVDARDDAVAAKQYAEAAITDTNMITVATDLQSTPSNIKTVATNISNINTVAGISSDVTTVAGISSDVTTVSRNSSNVTAVATSISNVNKVGNDISNVNSVADDLTNIYNVAGDLTNIDTVAGVSSEVSTVAGISNNVTTVAGISSNVSAVAGNASNINAVAGNNANITAVAGNATNINAVNANKTNIDTVAGDKANIDTVVGMSTAVSTVADNDTNITTVATNISDISTTATNISAINTNAANIMDIQNASSNAALAKQYAVGLPTEPQEKSAKWWAEHSGIPDQTGQSGKFLTTDGTGASWANVDALPSQTGQSGKFLTTNGTNASWANVPTRNIGEIVESTIPLTDAGLHLLDGGVISGGGAYSAFVDYIASLVSNYPDLFETEANWQQSVTTYGVCGKFVYDSVNNTVRLPKITGFTEGTIDPTVLGDLTEAGLPNITGNIGQTSSNNGIDYSENGALYWAYKNYNYPVNLVNNTNYNYGVSTSFDASRSNSIYGNSSTVQPQSIKVLYYIVIATMTKTDIQVDIDEVMTDLNDKVDKSDLAPVQCVIETYSSGTEWYRIWSDGWIEQGGEAAAGENVTVTFPKAFKNTNYTVIATSIGTNSAIYAQCIQRTSASQMIIYNQGGNTSQAKSWYACGY